MRGESMEWSSLSSGTTRPDDDDDDDDDDNTGLHSHFKVVVVTTHKHVDEHLFDIN